MELALDNDRILGHFDRLVEEGTVVYNDYTIFTTSDKGFPACFSLPSIST